VKKRRQSATAPKAPTGVAYISARGYSKGWGAARGQLLISPEAAERLAQLSGRKRGSMSETTKHIHQLAREKPTLKPKELRPHVTKRLAELGLPPIDSMSDGTFRNHVGTARRK
jgi:hypothetical protein